MIGIVQKDNPTLRQTASNVARADMRSKKLLAIIARMSTALAAEDDGVAIAAPQIGVPLRIFVVAGKIFKKEGKTTPPDKVFINPELMKLSKEKEWMEEGCLSVRWLYGEVERSTKATVRAYDEHGKRFTLGGAHLLAQIFQHEIDHLDGTLFIDKARNVHALPPDKPSHEH